MKEESLSLSVALQGYYFSMGCCELTYNGKPIEYYLDRNFKVIQEAFPKVTRDILRSVLLDNVCCGDSCCWDGECNPALPEGGECGIVIKALKEI